MVRGKTNNQVSSPIHCVILFLETIPDKQNTLENTPNDVRMKVSSTTRFYLIFSKDYILL